MSKEPSLVIFNSGKKEVALPNTTMKKLAKKYSPQKIVIYKDKLDLQKIKLASLIIFAGPREPFEDLELVALKAYFDGGGAIFFMSGEGGDRKNNSNISKFLKPYGIQTNNDLVIRSTYYKYMHPSEALVSNGILNDQVIRVVNGQERDSKPKQNNPFLSNIMANRDDEQDFEKEAGRGGIDFIFVRGTSLLVNHPAIAVLSSGPLTYPNNRPVGALMQARGKGRLAVVGSVEMFCDDYFELEQNNKIFDFFIKFLLTNQIVVESPKEDFEREGEFLPVPDIAQLADKLKSCFEESEDVSNDLTSMLNTQLYKLDTNLVPESIKLYETLGVKHQALALIAPQLQVPLLGLSPATFPPITKELPAPPLQLFDLDDQFALDKVRLAQCTNKCENKDIEYFVREAGDILGVSDKVKNRSEPKSIVKYILEQIINYKRSNPR